MFPGRGDALSQLWRRKQIEYTQLRTLSDPEGARYRPFWDITLDALRHAGRSLGLELGAAAEKRLMDEYACLSTYPDTVPALRRLRELPGEPRLAILSNGDSRIRPRPPTGAAPRPSARRRARSCSSPRTAGTRPAPAGSATRPSG